MAIRRDFPATGLRSSPTAFRISPGRSPAFSRASTGPRKNAPKIEWLASVPGDCPFLPNDLVPRLHAARIAEKKPLACARSGEWRHPVAGLWPVALRDDLRRALTVEGLHKIETWTGRHGVALAAWPDQPLDPFFNVNTPEDLAKAEKIAARNPDS